MKNFLCLLIFSTFLGSSFELFKIGPVTFTAFRIIFILFVIFHILLIGKNTNNRNSPVAKKYINYLAIILFFNLFTLIQTPSFLDWINGCIFYAINILLISFVYIYTDNKKDLSKYIISFILGIFMTIVISIYEYKTGNHIISANYFSIYSTSSWEYQVLSLAPTGFLYNPNNIGTLMILGLGFGLYFIKNNKGWLLFAVWSALCVYVSFATGSRGAIILIFISIIISVLLGVKGALRKNFLLFFLLILGSFLFVKFNGFIFEQLDRSGLLTSKNDFSSDSRWQLIRLAMKACVETIFLGTGPMTAEAVLIKYFNLSMASVHNFWIELLLTGGIGIFICFVAFYFRCIKVQWKLRFNDTANSPILVALIMFAAAVFIPPTVVSLNFVWLIFGFSIATEKLYYNETGIIL